jgi:hypothetical protein
VTKPLTEKASCQLWIEKNGPYKAPKNLIVILPFSMFIIIPFKPGKLKRLLREKEDCSLHDDVIENWCTKKGSSLCD